MPVVPLFMERLPRMFAKWRLVKMWHCSNQWFNIATIILVVPLKKKTLFPTTETVGHTTLECIKGETAFMGQIPLQQMHDQSALAHGSLWFSKPVRLYGATRVSFGYPTWIHNKAERKSGLRGNALLFQYFAFLLTVASFPLNVKRGNASNAF